MRRLSALLLGSTALLSLGGCLKAEEVYTLHADGSGTIEAKYSADLEKLRTVVDIATKTFPGDAEAYGVFGELPDPFHRRWFDKAAQPVEGYTIAGYKAETKDGVRKNSMRARFTSLKAAAKGGAFFASTAQLEQIDWPPPAPSTEAPKTGEQPAPKPTQRAWRLTLQEGWIQAFGAMTPKDVFPAFKKHVADLEVVRRFKLPSKVLSSNGAVAEDKQTVTFTHTYATLSKLKAVKMEVVFAHRKELKLEPFRQMANVMALIPRFTRPIPKPAAPPLQADD